MSVFISVGILILSMLISAFLLLSPSIFANFFHYASGKFSRQKADDLSIFYIIGAEFNVVLIFLFTAIILWAIPLTTTAYSPLLFAWILAGILVALAISVFFFYFKRTGQFFISRKLAKYYITAPKSVKSRSDAFILGFISKIPELPFVLPLYFLSIIVTTCLSSTAFFDASIIILFAIITTLPLFLVHYLFRIGYNLADYLRFKQKYYQAFKILLVLLYFIGATLLFTSGGIAI